MPAALRGCRAAFIFLTRIPVGGFPYTPLEWRWSTAWFPFVGAALGIVMAGAFSLFRPTGALPGAIIVVMLGAMLTGAFHEDGLADTADAMGGAFDREKLFIILKDSRVGSFGALALMLVVLLRVALLAKLDARAPIALVLSQCAARTPPVWLMVALPYATRDAEAKSRQVSRAGPAQALVATLWPLMVVVASLAAGQLSVNEALALPLVAAGLAAVCAWRFLARAGGITGDFLGATQQLQDCAILMVLAWNA